MEAGPPGREASAKAGQAAGGRQANTEAGREQTGPKGGFSVKCRSLMIPKTSTRQTVRTRARHAQAETANRLLSSCSIGSKENPPGRKS